MSLIPAVVVSDPALLGGEPRRDSPLSKLDRLGILISSVCVVHCLALPLVIALLPVIAEVLPADIWVHVVLIGFAVPVTGFTLLRGYFCHGDPRPTLMGGAGLALVASGIFATSPVIVVALTVVGGLLVAGGHILNMHDYRVPRTNSRKLHR